MLSFHSKDTNAGARPVPLTAKVPRCLRIIFQTTPTHARAILAACGDTHSSVIVHAASWM